MAYAVKYTSQLLTMDANPTYPGFDFFVRIYQDGYGGSIIPIILADNPVDVKFNEQEYNFLQPILSINGNVRLLIREGTTDPTIETFITTDDREYYIEFVYPNGTFNVTWFTAWLLPNESREGYININRVLTLNFSCGLAKLKEIPLVDYNGDKFDRLQRHSLIDLIKGCLWQAQPSKNIQTFDNLFAFGTSDRTVVDTNDPLYQTKVDARTFMKDSSEFEDCYTVLSKILSARGLQVFMDGGNWVVANLITYIFYGTEPGTEYDPAGAATAIATRTWSEDIEAGGKIAPVEQLVDRSYLAPVLKNRINFNYEDFPFLVCNESFLEGSPTSIECWAYEKGTLASPTAGLYTYGLAEEVNVAGIVVDRFAYITADFANDSWMKSEPFRVEANGLLGISIQRRQEENPSPANVSETRRIMGVYLYADDGTYWTLDDNTEWYQSASSGFPTFHKYLEWQYASGSDRQQWVSYSIRSYKIPRAGEIVLRLYDDVPYGTSAQKIYFKDLRITYTSGLLDRVADPISGDYDEIDLTTAGVSYRGEKNYQVYLSDCPTINTKGAYFYSNGTNLTETWYYNGLSGEQRSMKYWLATMQYWLSKVFRQRIEAVVKGIRYEHADGNFYMISPANRYRLVNGNPDKRYMSVSLGINVFMAKANIQLVEVNDVADAEAFPDHDGVHTYDFVTRKTKQDPQRFVVRWWVP